MTSKAQPYIYLASQSPRRSQLLDQIGVAHQILVADAAENAIEDAEALEIALKNEAPKDYVMRVTGLKLDAAVRRMKNTRLAECSYSLCGHHSVHGAGDLWEA